MKIFMSNGREAALAPDLHFHENPPSAFTPHPPPERPVLALGVEVSVVCQHRAHGAVTSDRAAIWLSLSAFPTPFPLLTVSE